MVDTKFTAGDFEIEAVLVSGLPSSEAHLSRKGMAEVITIKHSEMKDLAYIAERMIVAMRAALPGEKKHEMS